jgi:hypothetical protein
MATGEHRGGYMSSPIASFALSGAWLSLFVLGRGDT